MLQCMFIDVVVGERGALGRGGGQEHIAEQSHRQRARQGGGATARLGGNVNGWGWRSRMRCGGVR
jgi:hypothetical protein